jgi:hypothetical protein
MIPETVIDALAQWDAEKDVTVVEMGGLGQGYELAIHGLAFEVMRAIQGFTNWDDKNAVDKLQKDVIDPLISKVNKEPWGGFSGAQVGAAVNIAGQVCKRGYRVALSDKAVQDRLITLNKKDLNQAHQLQ